MPPVLEVVAQSICQGIGLTYSGPVGSGAFKETYKVSRPSGETLALKVHLPGKVSERAAREIDAMFRCAHPNIARLLDVKVYAEGANRYLYLLEEFLPGGTLGALLAVAGSLSRDAVLDLGEALIGAIAHTAALDLVHRDLKPENIMLRADGKTPVVVDFGLVRNLAETSLTMTWVTQGPGTPLYSTTEQLTNDKAGIDWRADQFALGIVLSIAGLGIHPYRAPGEDAALAVQRVAARTAQVPEFIQRAAAQCFPVLTRMTAVWPIHRYRKPELLLAAWVGQRGTI